VDQPFLPTFIRSDAWHALRRREVGSICSLSMCKFFKVIQIRRCSVQSGTTPGRVPVLKLDVAVKPRGWAACHIFNNLQLFMSYDERK
jgi:hypothetical protein